MSLCPQMTRVMQRRMRMSRTISMMKDLYVVPSVTTRGKNAGERTWIFSVFLFEKDEKILTYEIED